MEFAKPLRAAFARAALISTAGCGLMALGRGPVKMRIMGIVALGAALGGCASSTGILPAGPDTYTLSVRPGSWRQ
jgi:hypothetical protein